MADAATLQAMFAAAEQAFAQGRFDDVRSGLVAMEQAGVRHPAVFHLRGIVEHKLGAHSDSDRAFIAAAALTPDDPHLANNHGNLLGDMGDEEGALAAYERALRIMPGHADAALNRAIALHKLERFDAARQAFAGLGRNDPIYWNALAAMERDAGNLGYAAQAYDTALVLAPDNRLAARGRARVAAERGEGGAAAYYCTARAYDPASRDMLIEESEVLVAEGATAPLDALAAAVLAAPDWIEGQTALARLRWEIGAREGFTADIQRALQVHPRQTDLWMAYVQTLAGCGLYVEAADAAHNAAVALGDRSFVLFEAVHAGRAGDTARAASLFAALNPGDPARDAHEAVHRIRTGDLGCAKSLIDGTVAAAPHNMAYWAMAELVYRTTGDPRADWLSGQSGLIAATSLNLSADEMASIREVLETIHAHSCELIGQSIRSGTQTRGRLFDRPEPELALLRRTLDATIRDYADALPPCDAAHPLLRNRNGPLSITGSWSVRLQGSGYHVSHFHPDGIISSACYFAVPPPTGDREGWLELGRPPADLRLDLEPLTTIEPQEGRLVLFPSFLHHGTRPFASGERLSVAFDVSDRRRRQVSAT